MPGERIEMSRREIRFRVCLCIGSNGNDRGPGGQATRSRISKRCHRCADQAPMRLRNLPPTALVRLGVSDVKSRVGGEVLGFGEINIRRTKARRRPTSALVLARQEFSRLRNSTPGASSEHKFHTQPLVFSFFLVRPKCLKNYSSAQKGKP